MFDAGGSAFDSEVWCDAKVVKDVYKRPPNVFSSVTVRLTSPEALAHFKDALTSDPRLTVQVDREIEYYDKQSRALTRLILVLGTMVGIVMGIGAGFGALNTMYSAVAERTREIATMRALGFGAGSVVSSFVFEALCIALVGGVLGCLAILPLNGLTTGTMNWQTFSHLAFAFRVTPRGAEDGARGASGCALSAFSTSLAFASMVGGSRPVKGMRPCVRAVASGASSPRSIRWRSAVASASWPACVSRVASRTVS